MIQPAKGSLFFCLHGWGGCAQSFLPVFEHLNKEYRVIAPDLPGFGTSSEPPGPWSVSEYKGIIQKLILELGIAPCHIIAHSFGGRVAILLASQNPEMVRKIDLMRQRRRITETRAEILFSHLQIQSSQNNS